MDDIRLKMYNPVITGTPNIGRDLQHQNTKTSESGTSFQELLNNSIKQHSEVEFSKHAVKRTLDHNIEISHESLERLNEGVRLANDKNLDDTLIMVDDTAFLVNVKNNTVITALNSASLRGMVFTNITGAVIV